MISLSPNNLWGHLRGPHLDNNEIFSLPDCIGSGISGIIHQSMALALHYDDYFLGFDGILDTPDPYTEKPAWWLNQPD